MNTRKQQAFFAKGGFGNDHAQCPGIVHHRAILQIGAYGFIPDAFPDKFVEQDAPGLNHNRQHKNRERGYEDLMRHFQLKGPDDGRRQHQVHDQAGQGKTGLFVHKFQPAQDPSNGQQQKYLYL